MSIVYAFLILLMIALLGYMFYRWTLRRKTIIFVLIFFQMTALSVGLISFINNVGPNNIIEACYILFGIIIPSGFLINDYKIMMNKIREHGVFEGFVEVIPRDVDQEENTENIKTNINPIIKERNVPEIVKDINLNQDDILRNMKKSLAQAQLHIDNKEYEHAYEIYSILTNLIINCPVLYYNYGNVCYLMGRYKEAVQNYKTVLEVDDKLIEEINSPEDVFTIVKRKRNSNRQIFDNPKTSDDIRYEEFMVYYNMGNAHFMMNEYELALDDYNNAYERNSHLEEVCENIAKALIALQKNDEALDYYKNVVEGDQENYKIHYILGKLYYEVGKIDESIEELRECIRLNSDYVEGYVDLAKALIKLKNYDEAIDLYNIALENKPDNSILLYRIASAYALYEKYDSAIEALRNAVVINNELIDKIEKNKVFDSIRNIKEYEELVSLRKVN